MEHDKPVEHVQRTQNRDFYSLKFIKIKKLQNKVQKLLSCPFKDVTKSRFPVTWLVGRNAFKSFIK